MSQPFVGEIRMFGGNFAPAGWAFCEGQLMAIAENEALFTLIGTTYGGDGQSTFALPDLRGRVPIHMGNGFVEGGTGGVEGVILTVNQIPGHSHPLLATDANQQLSPANALLATPTSTIDGLQPYAALSTNIANLVATTVQTSGGGQPHDNFQPYLCVSFIISLFGLFPSQS